MHLKESIRRSSRVGGGSGFFVLALLWLSSVMAIPQNRVRLSTMERPVGPEVANEVDTESTDSVAVRQVLSDGTGGPGLLVQAFPLHLLFLFLLSATSFKMLRSLPQTLSSIWGSPGQWSPELVLMLHFIFCCISCGI